MHHQELKRAGLKVTQPRRIILQLLENNRQRHLSAEDVYKILLEMKEEVGLATIYRVLTQFEAVGLVIRHHFEGGSSMFELNEGYHHDHLVCVKCGKIVEFVDNLIEERQREIAQQHGFEITDHCLYLYGICSSCKNQ